MDKKILRVVVIAFLAAVIAATGFFRVPVPGLQSGVVIQNAMCVLTAVLLGGVLGAAPSALFFTVGVLGVPIFAGWTGGFAVLANVNGGFRAGWVLGALVAGLVSGKACVEEKKITAKSAVKLSVAVFAGMLALYIPEIFWVIGYRSHAAYFNDYTVQQLGLAAEYAGQVAKYTPEIIEKFSLDPSLAKQVISFTPEVISQLGLDADKIGLLGTAGAVKMFFTMFFAPFLLVDSIKAVFVILLSLKLRPVVAQYVYQ